MSAAPGGLAAELTAALERVLAADPTCAGRPEGLHRLSGGASRETWALDVVFEDGSREPLILQRARPGSVPTGPGMAGERALLEAATAAGVPVPAVFGGGDGDDGVGAPYLLVERVVGETIPRKILRDDRFAAARAGLAAECGSALAAVHRIPLDGLDLDHQDQIAQFRGLLDWFDEPHPSFELAFRWLEANRPPSSEVTVVHGDFRLGNLLVDDRGLQAVLDWELAHAGDPMEDLGWLCVKSWRFGAELPVGGFGTYDDLFSAYAEASGRPVDPEVVRWWQVLGTLKWGIMCIVQAQSHLSGASRSVELAAIGRRTCENEHDLMLLLP